MILRHSRFFLASCRKPRS